MIRVALEFRHLAKHVAGLLILALSLTACVAPAWQQRDAARSLTTDWEKVGFTDERQIEILKGFGCSDIELRDEKTFMQDSVGNHCTVLGEKIPRMMVVKYFPAVHFSGFCPPFGTPADPNRADIGRQVQARLNAQLPELSQQVFQGKAEGRLQGLASCLNGHLDTFTLKPNLR